MKSQVDKKVEKKIKKKIKKKISEGSDASEFIIGDLIGQGAFGKVYKGKYKGKTVAVKILNNEDEAEAEVAALRKLAPICDTYAVCLHDAWNSYIVMDLIPGHPLHGSLDYSNKPLRDTVHALTKIHEMGVTHGDPHANNILWNPETGKYHIIDFGFESEFPAKDEDWSLLSDTLFYHYVRSNNDTIIKNLEFIQDIRQDPVLLEKIVDIFDVNVALETNIDNILESPSLEPKEISAFQKMAKVFQERPPNPKTDLEMAFSYASIPFLEHVVRKYPEMNLLEMKPIDMLMEWAPLLSNPKLMYYLLDKGAELTDKHWDKIVKEYGWSKNTSQWRNRAFKLVQELLKRGLVNSKTKKSLLKVAGERNDQKMISLLSS